MIKGMKLQVAIGAIVDGTITFVATSKEKCEQYKRGEITGWQVLKDVSPQPRISNFIVDSFDHFSSEDISLTSSLIIIMPNESFNSIKN